MQIKTLTTCAIVSLLFACVPYPARPQYVRSQQFVDAEYAQYEEAGTASIAGQAFLRTRGGDVKTAAGFDVFCLPATSYSQEWFDHEIAGGYTPAPKDPKAQRFVRATTADSTGRFSFKDLPAGIYYVFTKVIWEVPSPSQYYVPIPEGGYVYAMVQVKDGEQVEKILSR